MSRMHHQTRHRSRRLFLEALESRRVLDGGTLPALLGAVASDLGASGPTQNAVAPQSVGEAPGISRFTSAQELQDYLSADARQRYQGLFGQPAWWWGGPWMDYVTMRNGAVAANAGSLDKTGWSETNVQVAGVDEGDMVETDGRYLYLSGPAGITIVDTADAAGLAIAARIPGTGQPVAMYLHDTHLSVVTVQWSPYDVMPLMATDAALRPAVWTEPKVALAVYDVATPAQPHLVGKLDLEGSYVDSRFVGDTLLLVSQSGFYLPGPQTVPVETTDGDAAVPDPGATGGVAGEDDPSLRLLLPLLPEAKYRYETEAEYFARIGDAILTTVLPEYWLTGPEGAALSPSLLTPADGVYHPLGGNHDNLVSLTAIHIDASPSIVAAAGVPTDWASQLYVSLDNVYLVSPQWSELQTVSRITQVHYDLEAGRIDLAAIGRVPGMVPNPFALDEQDGFLRIVTQTGWTTDAHSDLYVLAENGDQLETVGRLENLAPGERLYSVRFLGDTAFVVTFGPDSGVWADPLLTIDLSDPTHPQLRGELEIPGFSNYLQTIAGGYLIGLGRDADETNGRALEPQVSLYDVADLRQPQLVDRVSFGNGWSWSEAFSTHHAISYFPEYGVLAIPMDTWLPVMTPVSGEGDPSTSPLPVAQHVLWVFQISADATDRQGAIEVLGTIAHPTSVLRSVRIGERLYSISQDWVKVHALQDPGQALGELFLREKPPVDEAGARMAELARQDLAVRLGVPVEEITVRSVEPVAWPDSSLGLPEPDRVYLPVIVPGFRVVLEHGAAGYVYHTDSGERVLLAKRFPLDPPVVPAASPEVAEIRLEIVDASGNPVKTVEVGDEFVLQVYAADLRTDPQGVQAAYVDVLFGDKSVSVAGPITFAAGYTRSTSGDTTTPGLLDEVGAAQDGSNAGPAKGLLASIPFRATEPGPVRFALTPADAADHGVVLAGQSEPAATEDVRYVGTSLAVFGWHNTNDACDVNNDGKISTVDVLLTVNELNLHGIQILGRAVDALAAAPGAVQRFFDVNRDGKVAPVDVLKIVNRLNGYDPSQATVPAIPVSSLVDWVAVQEVLAGDTWAQPLQLLGLTPDQALDTVHQTLSEINLSSLSDDLPAGVDRVQFRRDCLHRGGERLVNRLTSLGQEAASPAGLSALAAAAAQWAGATPGTRGADVLTDEFFAKFADARTWFPPAA